MVEGQSIIPPSYRIPVTSVKRLSDMPALYAPGMRKAVDVRTPFAMRLIEARTMAGLTQTELAKAAGMAQSTYGEAETTANGSRKVAQLAAACRVHAEWLATGKGPKLLTDPPQRTPELPPPPATKLREALQVIAAALADSTNPLGRVWPRVALWLSKIPTKEVSVATFATEVAPLLEEQVSPMSATDNGRPGPTGPKPPFSKRRGLDVGNSVPQRKRGNGK